MIAIIDYGMGNLHSVQKATELFGVDAIVSDKPDIILKADKIILPGVGAFDDAMKQLKNKGMIETIKEYTKNKKPLIGICLGMQLLFEESEEALQSKGLGLLKGKVVRFKPKPGLKVPHIGWNQLKRKTEDQECKIMKGVADKPYVYFCHSYYPDPEDTDIVAATTEYGLDFTSVICKDNIYAVQFHPEKSQGVGLKILENFVKLC